MALDQQTFDTELAGLVAAIEQLDAAVDALIASQPAGVDLSAEGEQVAAATQAVQDELSKLQHSATSQPPTSGTPSEGGSPGATGPTVTGVTETPSGADSAATGPAVPTDPSQ